MSLNTNVHIIITGGTIDSVFSPAFDRTIINDHSIIMDYIDKSVKPHGKITAETLTLKDSRDISDNIRAELVECIKSCSASSIIITHGTYTMPQTAQYLQQHLGTIDKTIVMTGSLLPLHGFSGSDAPYNLGYAIASAQLLQNGVYLAMNGYIFNAGNVVKDTENGVFKEIHS